MDMEEKKKAAADPAGELRPLEADMNIIAKLDDEPNDVGGLTSAELKAEFDKAGNTIKTYLNETLIPDIEGSPDTPGVVDKKIEAHNTDPESHKTEFDAKQENLVGKLHEVTTFDKDGNVISRVLEAVDMGGGLYVCAEAADAPVRTLINTTTPAEAEAVLRGGELPPELREKASAAPMPSFGMGFSVLLASGNTVPAFKFKFFQDTAAKEYPASISSGGDIPTFTPAAGKVGTLVRCAFADGVIQMINPPGVDAETLAAANAYTDEKAQPKDLVVYVTDDASGFVTKDKSGEPISYRNVEFAILNGKTVTLMYKGVHFRLSSQSQGISPFYRFKENTRISSGVAAQKTFVWRPDGVGAVLSLETHTTTKAVSYEAQTLTEEERQQVWTNIGLGSASEKNLGLIRAKPTTEDDVVEVHIDPVTYELRTKVGGAAGGVLTFNGRKGDVYPKAGDYNAEQVGAVLVVTIEGQEGSYTAKGSNSTIIKAFYDKGGLVTLHYPGGGTNPDEILSYVGYDGRAEEAIFNKPFPTGNMLFVYVDKNGNVRAQLVKPPAGMKFLITKNDPPDGRFKSSTWANIEKWSKAVAQPWYNTEIEAVETLRPGDIVQMPLLAKDDPWVPDRLVYITGEVITATASNCTITGHGVVNDAIDLQKVLKLKADKATVYSKAESLSGATKTLYGLPASATPDDVFKMLAELQGRYKIGVQVNLLGVSAGAGIQIKGLTSASGGAVTTNAAGYAEGFADGKIATLTIDKVFEDVPTKSISVDTHGRVFTKATINLTSSSGKIEVKQSTTLRFSSAVKTVDLFGVGGGGSGAVAIYRDSTASGGAGGYTKTLKGVAVVNRQITVTIGAGGRTAKVIAGGSSGYDGNQGGTTTITTGSTRVTAPGGNGGRIDGNGADGGSGSGGVDSTNRTVGQGGSNGSNGDNANTYKGGKGQGTTTTAFGENTGVKYSGAGAGAYYNSGSGRYGVGSPGADGGGTAYADETIRTNVTVNPATVPGGGGGGAAALTINAGLTCSSGAGADGLAIIKW